MIFYELLTGEKPFPGTTSAPVMHRVLSEEPLNPSVINTQLPKELDAVALSALAKDYQERFQSAREFLQMIDTVLRRHSGPGRAREVSQQAPVIGDPQALSIDPSASLGRASAGGNRLSAARRLSTTLQRGPASRGQAVIPPAAKALRIEPTLDHPVAWERLDDARAHPLCG